MGGGDYLISSSIVWAWAEIDILFWKHSRSVWEDGLAECIVLSRQSFHWICYLSQACLCRDTPPMRGILLKLFHICSQKATYLNCRQGDPCKFEFAGFTGQAFCLTQEIDVGWWVYALLSTFYNQSLRWTWLTLFSFNWWSCPQILFISIKTLQTQSYAQDWLPAAEESSEKYAEVPTYEPSWYQQWNHIDMNSTGYHKMKHRQHKKKVLLVKSITGVTIVTISETCDKSVQQCRSHLS